MKGTSYNKVLEILSLLVLVSIFYPLCFWNQIGDGLIPIHYNAYGYADGWGRKEYLLFLPLFSVVLYLIMFFFERKYERINYSIKLRQVKSKEEFEELKVLLLRQMKYIKLLVVCMFSYLSNISFYFASMQIPNPQIEPFIMIAFLIITVVVSIRFSIIQNKLGLGYMKPL